MYFGNNSSGQIGLNQTEKTSEPTEIVLSEKVDIERISARMWNTQWNN